jgi:hypothetical protein
MARPGVVISTADAPPARGLPTSTGVWFAAGVTEKGPTDRAVKVTSLADFQRNFGNRASFAQSMYDAADVYFREGGTEMYVGRVVGATPVVATTTINDSGAAPSIRVDAKNAGEWGNDLSVAVEAGSTGGTFVLVITDANDNELERSGDLADVAAAATWSTSSSYVDVVAVGSNDPAVVAATALATGADDRASIGDSEYGTALGLFTRSLGPGQVSIPGVTTTEVHQLLAQHAADNNRVALADLPDTPTVGTLTALATTIRNGDYGSYVGFFGPWVVVPGIVAGTTRTVPMSAVQAGVESRRDQANSPNIQAAGEDFAYRYVTRLTTDFSDADRETLLVAGINTAKNEYGSLMTFGYRSAADPDTVPTFWQFNHARLRMAISAKAERIGSSFLFKQIDGKGHTTSRFENALKGMLLGYYEQGSLYGDAPEQSFRVNVGNTVNTPETIAAGELHAVLEVRMSYGAELVRIDIVTVPITQAL